MDTWVRHYLWISDIIDDEIIGLKSTSIKFKKNPHKFLVICYSMFIICILITGILMKFDNLFFIFLVILFLHLVIYQIKKFQMNNPKTCFEIFKSNNIFGFIVFINILIGKI